jgi:Uroporphyrinogen decarboxylase (URO-D)
VSSAVSAKTELGARAQLALDTIKQVSTPGISQKCLHIMEHAQLERLAGAPPGSYAADPEDVYLRKQLNIGTCSIDQWIPRNPLSMGARGYEDKERGATTGAEEIELDGMLIDSPEAVVEHLEKCIFPELEKSNATFNVNDHQALDQLIEKERQVQTLFGPEMLKIPYGQGYNNFPQFRYGTYGYVNYFCAYGLYPEVIEKDFRLQADLAVKKNRLAARAYTRGELPPMLRLDHDMADSRSTLVDIKSLDAIWFPQFARSLEPYIQADIKLIWHCDGNLMQMVPRLLECGLSGFQGFQYEDGMDYEKICKMTNRDGAPLLIQAGVSVTTTLPHGTPDDVRKELKWVVDNGPETGLFLSATSSVAPGVPPENLDALVAGLNHYRDHGKN